MAESKLSFEDLRWAATLRRMSLRDVARAAGIDYQRTQRLFREDRRPKPGELQRIARAVGVER